MPVFQFGPAFHPGKEFTSLHFQFPVTCLYIHFHENKPKINQKYKKIEYFL